MKSASLALLVFLLALAGCTAAPKQAYPGPRLSPQQGAVLSAAGKHSTVGFDNKTFISSVDGQSMRDVRASLAGQMFPFPHLVYLTPGRHTVEFIVSVGLSSAKALVWFDAEAGQTYVAQHRTEGYRVRMWIENSKGEPVGGVGQAPQQ